MPRPSVRYRAPTTTPLAWTPVPAWGRSLLYRLRRALLLLEVLLKQPHDLVAQPHLHCAGCEGAVAGDLEVRLTGLWKDHDLVFTTEFGTAISRADLITRSFKPLLKKAGLPDIRFHDLRHKCATLLLGRGVHVKLAQVLLGHSSVAVTLDTYSHVLPGMDDGLADTMDAALS